LKTISFHEKGRGGHPGQNTAFSTDRSTRVLEGLKSRENENSIAGRGGRNARKKRGTANLRKGRKQKKGKKNREEKKGNAVTSPTSPEKTPRSAAIKTLLHGEKGIESRRGKTAERNCQNPKNSTDGKKAVPTTPTTRISTPSMG